MATNWILITEQEWTAQRASQKAQTACHFSMDCCLDLFWVQDFHLCIFGTYVYIYTTKIYTLTLCSVLTSQSHAAMLLTSCKGDSATPQWLGGVCLCMHTASTDLRFKAPNLPDLVQLLLLTKGKKKQKCGFIIIYCTSRLECIGQCNMLPYSFPTLSLALSPNPTGSYWRSKSVQMGREYIVSF